MSKYFVELSPKDTSKLIIGHATNNNYESIDRKIRCEDIYQDNIVGNLYTVNDDKGQIMIVIGGGDGNYKWTKKIAEGFAINGINTFSCAYWNEKTLPKSLNCIPVEYLKDVKNYLKSRGYEKIGIWGISKGAEYILLTQSLLNCFDFLIAVSPIDYCLEGISKNDTPTNNSSWSYGGEPVSYLKRENKKLKLLVNCILKRELNMKYRYEKALNNKNELARIKTENIKCPTLLLSSSEDSMWGSRDACLRIQSTNKNIKHINYEYGSHVLIPLNFNIEKIAFKIARKKKIEYQESKIQSTNDILKFINNL